MQQCILGFVLGFIHSKHTHCKVSRGSWTICLVDGVVVAVVGAIVVVAVEIAIAIAIDIATVNTALAAIPNTANFITCLTTNPT